MKKLLIILAILVAVGMSGSVGAETVYRCDRCEKLTKEITVNVSIDDYWICSSYGLGWKVRWSSLNGYKDICKDCTKALIRKWLKKEDKKAAQKPPQSCEY